MRKATLNDGQMRLARQIEAAGLTTVSQAIKTIERAANGDTAAAQRLAEWKKELAARHAAANQ